MKVKIMILIACISLLICACSSKSSLEIIAGKDVSEYTVEDCKTILHSSQEDIYSAFNVDPQKDLAGLLLEGRTLATPVLPLSNYVYQCAANQDMLIRTDKPKELGVFSLVFFGENGTKTILKDFTNDMILDETKYQAQDAFWKGYEGGEQLPAKRIEIIEGDLLFDVYFTQAQGETDFTLSSIHVSMLS